MLKLSMYRGKRPAYSEIAAALSMSPSEVHAAVKRAQASRLLHGREMGDRPNITALKEFLFHGLKYAFPAKRGEPTRGVPTSYAAKPLRKVIAPNGELPPVWPYAEGKTRGVAFEPLYKLAPAAALRDLYEYLALVDALRDGRARTEICRRDDGRAVAIRCTCVTPTPSS